MLVEPPYNMRRDHIEHDLEYYVFTFEDMRDMTKTLENVMKPGAYGHVLYSSLQFGLSYKSLLSQFREERASIALESDDSGSDSE